VTRSTDSSDTELDYTVPVYKEQKPSQPWCGQVDTTR